MTQIKNRICKLFVLPVMAATTLSACALTGNAQDTKQKSPLSFDGRAGVAYNDNIFVNELDSSSGESDKIGFITGRVKLDHDLGENTEFNASYRYSRNAHTEFSRFDTQTHLFSTGLEHDFGDVEIGVSYQYADSELDNDGFLTLNQISPYVEKYFGKKLLLRGTYGYVDKQFDGRPTRDATVNKGGADVYYFIDGVKRYVQTGYNYEDVDAVGPEFDHGAHNLKLRYIQRIPFNKRNAKFEAGWRYEKRDYDNLTPSIGEVRDDNRHRFQAEVELPITDSVYGLIELEHATNSSNLPSADLNRNSASASVGVRF